MSAVATRERHPGGLERGSAEPPAQRLFEPKGPTLEDSIVATWRDLTNADSATCPVCSGEMSRAGGCTSCGTVLD
jgi:hypothetical protein